MLPLRQVLFILFLLTMSLSVQAIELIDKNGSLNAKVFSGKIYNDRGRYTGMITPEGKMYDKDGKFTGQIKDKSILDANGQIKGFIRDGKIYNKDGNYTGRLKR